MILNEVKRTQLLSQGKQGEKEKDGKSRYQKRVKSHIRSNVSQLNKLDFNKLFKDNTLIVSLDVDGETDSYLVTISFKGFLDYLHKELAKIDNKLSLRVVIRALLDGINSDDVYMRCSCLSKDTKIKLLDGSTPTVEELKDRFDSGESLYVYSVDDKGDFKPGEVEKVWITNDSNTDFIKVTLDNGSIIETTPDHLYMLRDGTYTQAKYLNVGQSLMPIYFGDRDGYQTIKFNSNGRYYSTYKQVASYFFQDDIERAKLAHKEQLNRGTSKMPYDVAIHHKDFIKSNNNPDNLQIMTSYDYWYYHAYNMSKKWEDQEFRDMMISKLSGPEHSEKMKSIKASRTPEQKQAQSLKNSLSNMGKHFRPHTEEEKLKMSLNSKGKNQGPKSEQTKINISNGLKEYYQNISDEGLELKIKLAKEVLLQPEIVSKREQGLNNYYNNLRENLTTEEIHQLYHDRAMKGLLKNTYLTSPKSQEVRCKMSQAHQNKPENEKWEHSKKISKAKLIPSINKLLSQGITPNEQNYIENYPNNKEQLSNIYKYWGSFDNFIQDLKLDSRYNHKITNIEYIVKNPQPVYDIKVKNFYNFLTEAGVILHNCPDYQYRISYWASRTNTIVGDKETRPSNITNPNNKLGSGCKHLMLVLSNTSWMIKLGSVIFNYINYMERNYKKLYADVIYPAIYDKKYEEPVQLDIDSLDNDELDTTSSMVDKSNKYARDKNKFQVGNKWRFQPKQNKNQLNVSIFDDDEDEQ